VIEPRERRSRGLLFRFLDVARAANRSFSIASVSGFAGVAPVLWRVLVATFPQWARLASVLASAWSGHLWGQAARRSAISTFPSWPRLRRHLRNRQLTNKTVLPDRTIAFCRWTLNISSAGPLETHSVRSIPLEAFADQSAFASPSNAVVWFSFHQDQRLFTPVRQALAESRPHVRVRSLQEALVASKAPHSPWKTSQREHLPAVISGQTGVGVIATTIPSCPLGDSSTARRRRRDLLGDKGICTSDCFVPGLLFMCDDFNFIEPSRTSGHFRLLDLDPKWNFIDDRNGESGRIISSDTVIDRVRRLDSRPRFSKKKGPPLNVLIRVSVPCQKVHQHAVQTSRIGRRLETTGNRF